MSEEMVRYYARRAAEYDGVYRMARWQDDLAILRDMIPVLFTGRRVFEVACGTGYWTVHVARHAARVHAVDLNEETLAIARSRAGDPGIVTFARADAYAPAPTGEPHPFDAGLAALWLSHVDRARMGEFLAAFHSHLRAGAPVLMFDERPSDERRTPASRLDEAGNRYEMRRLSTGEPFEIVKNFFSPGELEELFGAYARDVTYRELRSFWVLHYRSR